MTTLGHCTECGVRLVGKADWSISRPQGCRRHGGYGLCVAHYAQMIRRRKKPVTKRRSPSRAKMRSREEVLEDYLTIRDEVESLEDAAHRMGMTVSALDQALYRARRDGLDGRTPNQLRMYHPNQHTAA